MSLLLAALSIGTAHAGGSLVIKSRKYSVPETIDRMEQTVKAKDMKVFARIDHGGEAKKAYSFSVQEHHHV